MSFNHTKQSFVFQNGNYVLVIWIKHSVELSFADLYARMRKTVAVMSDRSLSLTLFLPVYKNNEICFIVEKLNESIKSSGIGFVSCFSH